MPTPASQRPFWQRKRWITAAVLWLVLAYIASAGPVCYLCGRGIIHRSPEDIYMPMLYFGPFWEYANWWNDLGMRHARGR